MTRKQDVELVQGVDDMQIGLLRIHDALVPAAQYAQLMLLAGEALSTEQAGAITRGACACLEAIAETTRLIEELRETGRVNED